MWSDAETAVDYLNFTETADLIVDLVRDHALLPVSIGVFGGWGAGKSSLLRLAENKFAAELLGEKPRHLIVKFDAWLYQNYDDARAALMEVIASALLEESKKIEGLYPKVKRFAKRINYLRLAGLVGDLGLAAATGGVTLGMVSGGIGLASRLMEGSATAQDATSIKDAAKTVKDAGKELIGEEEPSSPATEIADFRREYGEILSSLNKTLIVLIDNLDRCLPRNAIQTLEAIRLFLFLPNTAFVIAADEDMIRHAVKAHYNDPSERHVADYLDKLIQLPIRVPRLGVQEITAYIFMLFASLAKVEQSALEALRNNLQKSIGASWKQEPITAAGALASIPNADGNLRNQFAIAERLAPVLANAPGVLGNPRIVKRLLNTISLRTKLANKHGMPLDEAVIAKLSVFERCTSDAAYSHLCHLINDAPQGHVEFIEKLEEIVGDRSKVEAAMPEAWKAHVPFIADWIALEPRLADIDLRGAVYLSREVAPLRVSRSGLSAQATNCINTLLSVGTTASPSAKSAVQALAAAEQPMVMEAIIGELRKVADWSSRPKGVVGAQILATASPVCAQMFVGFLTSLPMKPPPLWLTAILKQ